MPTTKYGDISERTGVYAVAGLLKQADPILVLSKFGQTKPIPKNRSQKIKFRRAVPFKPALTPLTEGVRPESQKMKYEDVETTLKQYGTYTEITDVIEDTHEDEVLKDAIVLSGNQAGETMELLTWGAVIGGTNVIYANGVQRDQVNTVLSLAKIRQAVRTMMNNRAQKITNVLDGSVKVQTRPVEAAFIAVCHTDLEPDIRNLPGFVPVAQYGSRSVVSPNEFGSVENVRFVTSALLGPILDAGGTVGSNKVLSTTGTKADVYPVIILGQDAFGICPLKGKESAEIKVRNPGKPEKGDELGQTGSVGWKAYHTALILNQGWMSRLECAATQL
ncbi:MAG: N4-gp56 family major capsid protein [Haemophilus pittmaniae]|uniref:N4-gp56 family major capsid protein n=1 Tax=Haemophilus pittmaniae TaxID=249188 RepID=UPI0023F1F3A9|nr:N4-gp56 family major capsid protein [Haemophilus pittmaniae]MBS6026357.1 N4-gp56 family major capsid protein [Haemophilus pittmaniae]